MKNAIIFLFFLIALNASAQKYMLSYKAGLNFAKIKYTGEFQQNLIDENNIKIKLGIQTGGWFQINLNKRMALQFEFLFTQKGLKYKQLPYREGKIKTSYLELPALFCFKYKLEKSVQLIPFIGPYGAFWAFGKYTDTDYGTGITTKEKIDFSADYKYNRWDSGIIAGLSLIFTKNNKLFGTDFRYEHGILGSSIQSVDEYKHRVASLNFMFGYVFK